MSIDYSIRPVGAPAVVPTAGPAPEATKAAVQTDLPADKVVTASNGSQSSSFAQQPNIDFSNQVVIDRAAAEVVYKVVDNRTNLVIKQFPDDARLRSRAYLRAQDDQKQEKSKRKADIRI